MPRTFHRIESKINSQEPVERVYRPLHKMVRDNFIGGISWGLGATIGVGIVLGVVSFVLGQFVNIPILGERFADIIEATNQALQKR